MAHRLRASGDGTYPCSGAAWTCLPAVLPRRAELQSQAAARFELDSRSILEGAGQGPVRHPAHEEAASSFRRIVDASPTDDDTPSSASARLRPGAPATTAGGGRAPQRVGRGDAQLDLRHYTGGLRAPCGPPSRPASLAEGGRISLMGYETLSAGLPPLLHRTSALRRLTTTSRCSTWMAWSTPARAPSRRPWRHWPRPGRPVSAWRLSPTTPRGRLRP